MTTPLRFAVFLFMIFAIFFVANGYVYRRAAPFVGASPWRRRVLGSVLTLAPALIVLTRVQELSWPAALNRALLIPAWTCELAVLVACAFLLMVDLGRVPVRLTDRLLRAVRSRTQKDTEVQKEGAEGAQPAPTLASLGMGRRELITKGAHASALALGVGSSGYATLVGARAYAQPEHAVPMPGLSPKLDGFTIVQLSDLHVGLLIGDEEFRSAAALIAKAKPDLIVVTGDMIDHDSYYAPRLGAALAMWAPLARHGVAVIPGNHDHYAGIQPTLGACKKAGAQVLFNAGRVYGDPGPRAAGVAVLGVDDLRGHPDLDRAIAMVPPDLPRVLLAHQPRFFAQAKERVNLQLSGHTHGGQVNVILHPAEYILPHGYVAGLYREQGRHLYVNQGFGTAGPPARIGAPPEVSKIVLTSA